MFYSIIDAASLNNPTVLNDFHNLKVSVQYEPESPTSNYHFIFLLMIDNARIENAISKIMGEMKVSWYSFFWSDTILYIVFNSNQFQIKLPTGWSSEEYEAAQKFGRTQNIPEVYLDFKTHFQPYKDMVLDFGNKK